MDIQKAVAKMEKLSTKKKSTGLVKFMNKNIDDPEIIKAGLGLLTRIADEDAVNEIAHNLEHPDFDVRLAACRAGMSLNKEYLDTAVRHVRDKEPDEERKHIILETIREARAALK